MFKAIVKNTTLASCLILGISQVARANNAELLPQSISASKQGSQLESAKGEEVAQTSPRRTRTRRRPLRSTKKTYFGLGLGAFLSGDEISIPREDFTEDGSVEFSNGFTFSVFGGYRLSRYIAGELELSAAFGNAEFENVPDEAILDDLDIDYSVLSIYLAPRFELPLANDKFKLYASPGIGFSTVSTDIDTDRNLDGEEDELTSDTGFSYQIKAGAAYNINQTVSIFGQARYNNFALGDLDNLDGIAVEVGASF